MLDSWVEENLKCPLEEVGIIVVDHGSRRAESNALLHDVSSMFQQGSRMPIVEHAHMELAEPSIAQAFDLCVERGAKLVVVFPYFLSPGRHWNQDIPRLAAEAAKNHPSIKHLVTSPLGLHPLMGEIMQARIQQCLHHAKQDGAACNLCDGTDSCRLS